MENVGHEQKEIQIALNYTTVFIQSLLLLHVLLVFKQSWLCILFKKRTQLTLLYKNSFKIFLSKNKEVFFFFHFVSLGLYLDRMQSLT